MQRSTSAGLALALLRRGPTLRSGAVRGDAAAFAAVYERHHQALYRYCRSILQHDEDARDALQSAMAKAFAALESEQRDFELRPWLFRIAHNEAISRLRQRREVVGLDAVGTPATDSLTQAVEDRERLALLRDDLKDLPERQRAALVLRELSGLGHGEIAVVLNSSPRAVKQTIFEARVTLQECAEGRAMACADVQQALSDGDGRVLRGRRMRAHVRSCRACREFKAALVRRPADLAALAPPLPAVAGLALLGRLLPGAQATLAQGTALTAGAGGGLAGTLAAKAAVVVATTAAIAGTTTAATHVVGLAHHRAVPSTTATPQSHRPAATTSGAGASRSASQTHGTSPASRPGPGSNAAPTAAQPAAGATKARGAHGAGHAAGTTAAASHKGRALGSGAAAKRSHAKAQAPGRSRHVQRPSKARRSTAGSKASSHRAVGKHSSAAKHSSAGKPAKSGAAAGTPASGTSADPIATGTAPGADSSASDAVSAGGAAPSPDKAHGKP